MLLKNIDPPPPSPPGECLPPPPLLRGEDTLAGRRGGWGVNVLEDARHSSVLYLYRILFGSPLSFVGEAHIGARALLDMVWLYHSPIPVGRRGVIYLFKFFLPAVTGLEGGGPVQHPMGQPNNSRAGGLALLPGVNAAQRTRCNMVWSTAKTAVAFH